MKTIKIILFSIAIFFLSCEKNGTESETGAVIGRVLDKAANTPLPNATIIIESESNSYVTTTDEDGYFEKKGVIGGEYIIISKKTLDSPVLRSSELINEITDTLGIFNTEDSNWGDMYSKTFCSIIGTIEVSGNDDFSEVKVQLLGTEKTALTTNKGNYRFDFVFPGTYDIIISKTGFKKIQKKDINISQGDVYNLDSIINPIHKLIEIEESALSWGERIVRDFCFCDSKFWYSNGNEPIMSFDPILNVETPKLWENYSGYDFPYYLAWYCDITDTYENSFWICGDGLGPVYARRISIKDNKVEVIDSINIHEFNSGLYDYGWDTKDSRLVAPKNNELLLINTVTKTSSKVDVNLSLPYEDEVYQGAGGSISSIIITDKRIVYLLVTKSNLNNKTIRFLFKYNNLDDMTLLDSYIFPDTYSKEYGLSYYDGHIYLESDKLILE